MERATVIPEVGLLTLNGFRLSITFSPNADWHFAGDGAWFPAFWIPIFFKDRCEFRSGNMRLEFQRLCNWREQKADPFLGVVVSSCSCNAEGNKFESGMAIAMGCSVKLTLKIISAVGHATAPTLAFEIVGAVTFLSTAIQHWVPLPACKRNSDRV